MTKNEGQRKHARVRDDIPVGWILDQNRLSGKGILRNISVSGALLETKTMITVESGLLILLKAVEAAESQLVPPLARIVWGKKSKDDTGYFFYGLEFKDPAGTLNQALQARVEGKLRSAYYGLGTGI